MKFRVGGWLLASAFTALVILKLLRLGMRAAVPPAMTIAMVALCTVVMVGLVTWAIASKRWARVLFACAAVGQAGLIVVLLTSFDDHFLDALGVLTLLGPAAFAGAAMFRGAGKRLSWTLIPVATLYALGVVVAHVPVRGWAGPVMLDMMSLFIALDLLGAFPPRGHIPVIRIPNLALGRLVTVIGFALVAMGGWLLWTALDTLATHAVSQNTQLLFGAGAVLAGVLGLWRRRRPVSLPIVIAIVFGIACSLTVVEDLVKRPFDGAVLATRELPMARLALPAGNDTVRAFRDAGNIEIVADHVELDQVGIGWGYREPPTLDDPEAATTKVDGINAEISITIYDDNEPHRTAFLIWSCGEIQLRASFGAKAPYTRIHAFATKIARTIECVPMSPSTARLKLPVSLPPTYRELEIPDPGFRTFRGPDTIHFSLAWTKDRNWAVEFREDPLAMFEWFVSAETLRDVHDPVVKATTFVDGEYHWYGEIEVRGRRRLYAIYYCETLGAYAAAGFDGPDTVPTAEAMALVNSAGCP